MPTTLRSQLKQRRKRAYALSASLAAAKISKQLSRNKLKPVIASYLSFGSELPTPRINAALVKRGYKLFVPITHDQGQMTFVKWTPFARYETGAYGIQHPRNSKQRSIKPNALNVVLTPLVGFDERCNRLGMGGGYYDRYLAKAKQARKIGIAFEQQKVKRLDVQPWDQPLDEVITPARQYRRLRRK